MIQTENLTIVYPDKTKALDDVSFKVQKGESTAVIGANGAGKSTLLLALMGVIPSDGGKIIIDGIPVVKNNLYEIRSRIGLVFQNPDDQLFMPVIFEDVAFGPRNYGVNEAEVTEHVNGVLDMLGISHLKDRSPLKLSGGEKRAAAIATVLSMKPSAMLFDEPSAFLDPKARRNLINVLKGLKQTKLIATHDLDFAAELCSKVIILSKGKIFACGELKELLFDEKLMDSCGLEALMNIRAVR